MVATVLLTLAGWAASGCGSPDRCLVELILHLVCQFLPFC